MKPIILLRDASQLTLKNPIPGAFRDLLLVVFSPFKTTTSFSWWEQSRKSSKAFEASEKTIDGGEKVSSKTTLFPSTPYTMSQNCYQTRQTFIQSV